MSYLPPTEEEITGRLAAASRLPVDDPYPAGLVRGVPQDAAVLIPLIWQESGWQVLFIRRTENDEDRHGGQVAFPGGRQDAQDRTPEETATREAHEEIGLRPADVRLLGRLNVLRTITNYLVTPVVGVVPWPYAFQPQPSEVSRIFTIPLAWLADPAHHEISRRSLPSPHDPIRVIYFDRFDGEQLWGASARITLNFLSALGFPGS